MSIPMNGTHAQPQSTLVAAATWDACASGDLPPEGETASWRRAVVAAAEEAFGDVQIPTATDRLQAAMDLALTQGAVTLYDDGLADVRSGNRTYRVGAECPCADSQHRSKWCKHFLAVHLYKNALVLQEEGAMKEDSLTEDDFTPDDLDDILAEQEGDTVVRQAPPAKTSWRDQNPGHVHSMEWVDDLGIKHLHVIRADSREEVMQEAAGIKALIRQAREASHKPQAASEPPAAAAEAQEGWCAVHQVQMTRQVNAKGSWWSHKVGDAWCKGK